MKNGKKLYNERGITFFHETERYVNNLNMYNRSKNGTNLWDDLIFFTHFHMWDNFSLIVSHTQPNSYIIMLIEFSNSIFSKMKPQMKTFIL